GERVRFYRSRRGTYIWLPDENEEASVQSNWEAGAEQTEQEARVGTAGQDAVATPRESLVRHEHRDYDVEHYLQVLVTSYAARLRKAFAPEDFEQLFRLDGQSGLFDRPIESITPRWIRCS